MTHNPPKMAGKYLYHYISHKKHGLRGALYGDSARTGGHPLQDKITGIIN